jgi:molecular chaperone DnaK
MSLGIGAIGGVIEVFLNRTSTIPTKQTKIYTVQTNNQADILIEIYEDEQGIIKDNNLLGYFKLKKSSLCRTEFYKLR